MFTKDLVAIPKRRKKSETSFTNTHPTAYRGYAEVPHSGKYNVYILTMKDSEARDIYTAIAEPLGYVSTKRTAQNTLECRDANSFIRRWHLNPFNALNDLESVMQAEATQDKGHPNWATWTLFATITNHESMLELCKTFDAKDLEGYFYGYAALLRQRGTGSFHHDSDFNELFGNLIIGQLETVDWEHIANRLADSE